MKSTISRTGRQVSALAVLLVLSGCIGLYDNSKQFLNEPPVGMTEIELIKTYGTPAFATATGTDKILTYRVRDTKYILLYGSYEGYDLVIVLKNGSVVETHKVQLANAFALFQPWPWMVSE